MATIRNSISAEDTAKDLSAAMSAWLSTLKVPELFRTCTTCHFFENDRHCNKFNADPPGSVIVTGCDAYDDEEGIPF